MYYLLRFNLHTYIINTKILISNGKNIGPKNRASQLTKCVRLNSIYVDVFRHNTLTTHLYELNSLHNNIKIITLTK